MVWYEEKQFRGHYKTLKQIFRQMYYDAEIDSCALNTRLFNKVWYKLRDEMHGIFFKSNFQNTVTDSTYHNSSIILFYRM